MKIIELNIGLSTPQGETLNPCAVLNALTGRGFELITYRQHDSVCKDGIEKCLAVKCTPPADWQEQLRKLSNGLKQDCIAITGFIGHAPYDTFCADLWKSPENEPFEVKPSKVDSAAASYIEWLETTLIPDLKHDGYEATAASFEELIYHYNNK